MSRRLLLRTGALTVLLCAFGSIASAASLTIQWDANVESDLAGYVVRYGTSPGTYTTSVDVGRQISARVSNLVTGTRYYAVVEAYNTAGVHGARSGEVAGTATDPATVMTLTLKFIGNGEGILSAAGVSCSDNCTVSAAAGTTLTLSPVSNINSIFSGWEGSGCATGVVTIRASMTCSGRFSQMVSPTRFDANGDGRGDLLNYRATDGLTQVLRTAASGHGATTAYQSTWPAKWVLRAGDFNGDGRADVFAFDPATGAWQTALGDAQASLGVTRAASFAPAANVYVVDLNRDGLSDVFLHDPASGAWQKCLSTAAGFSCEAGTWPAGWEVYPLRTKAAAAGDLLLYNRSSGAIQKATNRATGFTLQAASVGAGWDVFTADFDGDGNADLLLHDAASGRWSVCINTVAGGVGCHSGQWAAGWSPMPLDLDGHGTAGVFLSNAVRGTTATARYTGSSFTVSATTTGGKWLLYRTADFNGDGKDDMVVTDQATGTVWQAINTGGGQFQLYVMPVSATASAAVTP